MSSADVRRVRTALEAADLVLIGASNGLDMAEGLNIFADDDHFVETYGDLATLDGSRSILEGMHFARRSFARTWAWQARFACREWLDYEPGAVMRPLHALVGDTDCFVITCNIDARFTRAGFDEFHVLETEGSVAKMTCSARCCDERHRTDEVVRALDASIVGGQVDQSLIPACPHCGAPLMCAIDERRLQQPDFQLIAQLDALEEFAQRHAGGNIVVLELGVGMRNGVVKRMLSHLVSGEPNLTYAVFNYNPVVFPHGLEQCCIGIDGDLAVAFAELSG